MIRDAGGVPAQCDRIALARVEYRGDLTFRAFGSSDDDGDEPPRRWRRYGLHADGHWLLFADAGRGWLVRDGLANASAPADLAYGRSTLPPLSTFRTDLGIGLDFDPLGVYVAKSVTDAKEPANFFLRVRRRF